jgi:hypothetical protein
VLLALFVSFLCLVAGAYAAGSAQPSMSIVNQCKADLAKRLNVTVDKVTFTRAYVVEWRDASLGLPEPGKMYAQVLTPGWQILLEGWGQQHLYTANSKTFRYGGPVELWKYSVLYLQPIENEPNLNKELWQCSLIGTNAVKICAGVTDVYPQTKGAILATRRTSRSGFDLVLVRAGSREQPRKLAASFAFGTAALNAAQDAWATIVKPGVGGEWGLQVGRIGESQIKQLALPEGWGKQAWQAQLEWREDRLIALLSNGQEKRCFEIRPWADKPTWQPGDNYYPPLAWSPLMLLNKSFSLVIGQAPIASAGPFDDMLSDAGIPVKPRATDSGEKLAVEIGERHFLGATTVKARIPGLTLDGFSLIGATEAAATRFAFVWGRMGDRQAAFTVDYVSGQVLRSFLGEPDEQEKPTLFNSPCLLDPLPIIGHVEPIFTPQ